MRKDVTQSAVLFLDIDLQIDVSVRISFYATKCSRSLVVELLTCNQRTKVRFFPGAWNTFYDLDMVFLLSFFHTVCGCQLCKWYVCSRSLVAELLIRNQQTKVQFFPGAFSQNFFEHKILMASYSKWLRERSATPCFVSSNLTEVFCWTAVFHFYNYKITKN